MPACISKGSPLPAFPASFNFADLLPQLAEPERDVPLDRSTVPFEVTALAQRPHSSTPWITARVWGTAEHTKGPGIVAPTVHVFWPFGCPVAGQASLREEPAKS